MRQVDWNWRGSGRDISHGVSQTSHRRLRRIIPPSPWHAVQLCGLPRLPGKPGIPQRTSRVSWARCDRLAARNPLPGTLRRRPPRTGALRESPRARARRIRRSSIRPRIDPRMPPIELNTASTGSNTRPGRKSSWNNSIEQEQSAERIHHTQIRKCGNARTRHAVNGTKTAAFIPCSTTLGPMWSWSHGVGVNHDQMLTSIPPMRDPSGQKKHHAAIIRSPASTVIADLRTVRSTSP